MTQQAKKLTKFLKTPGSLRFAGIKTLLIRAGFELVKISGSHHIFKHPAMENHDYLVLVVHQNDCLPVYKHKAAKWLKRIL